jgi:hypothetical protein
MRPSVAAAAATAVSILVLVLGAIGCGSSDNDEPPPSAVPPAPPEFFGVVPQGLLTGADIDRMQQGKVGHVRLVIPWGTLDASPRPDEGDFTTIDPILLLAAERGIRILPTIYGTPDWVAEDLDGRSCSPNCAAFAPSSDEAVAAFAEFAGQMVDRYGPGGAFWATHPDVDPEPVRAWQIWNEQNSPTFYQPAVDPAGYEKMLSAASEAIKERDPEAEVILGGMFGTPYKGKPPAMSAPEFLRALYALDGAADDFDAVGAHPYAPRQAKIEQQVRLLHDEIERAKDDASLWITEVGASSDVGENPLELGPDGQAAQLTEAFQYFLEQREAFDIEGVTWYSWRDSTDASQCDWCPGSGLFEDDGVTAKPAWDAFVAFTGGS